MSIGVPVTKSFNKLKKYPYEINKFDRRETNEYFYLPVDCPRMKKCDDAYCPLAHTKLEKIFHPIVYKTQACQMAKDGACDYFQKCAFYHDSNDKNEAHLNWTIWEKKWDKWRNNIDSILTQHNKNDKEIRRKVESILKIRMPHFSYTTNKNNLFVNKSATFHSTWPSLNNNNTGIPNMESVDIGNMGNIGQTGSSNIGSNIMGSGNIGNNNKLSNINNLLCKSMNSALFQYSSSIFNNTWSKGIKGNKKHIKNNNDNKNSNMWWLNQINDIEIMNLDKNMHNINENNINKNSIYCDETLSYNSNNGTECGVNYDILDNNAYKIVEFCFTDYDNNNNSNSNNNTNSNKNKNKWKDTADASNGQLVNSFFSQSPKGLSNDINYLQNINNNNNYNNQRNNIFQCINYNKTCEYIPNISEGIDDNKNKKYNTLETNYRDNFLADMNNSNKNFDFINSTFFSNSSNDITGVENYVNFPTMLEIIDDENNAVRNNAFSTGDGTTTNNYNNENDDNKNNENANDNDNDCNVNIPNTASYTDGFSTFYNNNTSITIDNNIKGFNNLDNCKTYDNFNFDDTLKNNISNLTFSGEDKEHTKGMKIKKDEENTGSGNVNGSMKNIEKELEENNETEDKEIKEDGGANTGNNIGSGNNTKGVNKALKKNKNKKGAMNNATSNNNSSSNNTESVFPNNIGDEESKNSSIINSNEVKTDINDKKKTPKKENRNTKNINSEKDQCEKGGSKKIQSCVSKIGSNNGSVSVNENACLENEKNKSVKCKNNENNKKGAYSKNVNINGDKNMSKAGKKNSTENFVSNNNDDADKKNVGKNKAKNIEKNRFDNRDNTGSIQLNRRYSDVLGENIVSGSEWNNTIKGLDKNKVNDNLINNNGKADKRKTNNNNAFSNSINKRESENDINNNDSIIVENSGLSLIYNSYYSEKESKKGKLENKKKNIIVDIENVNNIEKNNIMVNEKRDNNSITERCKNNTDILYSNTPINNNLFKYDQNLLINRGDNKNENVDRNMSSHMKESFCDYTSNNENKYDGNSILANMDNTEYIFNNANNIGMNNIKNSSDKKYKDSNYINSKDDLFVLKTIEYNKTNNETIEDNNRGVYNNYIINDVDSSINVENKSAHLENINTDSPHIKENINNVMDNISTNNSERINDTLNDVLNGALDKTMDSIFKIDTAAGDTYNELFNTLGSNSNNSGHNNAQNDEIKESTANNGQTNESCDYINNLLNIFLSCNSINENFDITNPVNTNFYEHNKSDTVTFNSSDKYTAEKYGELNNSSNYFNLFGNYNLYGSTCLQCKHYKNEIKNLIYQIKVLREEIIKYKQTIITYGINVNKDNTINPCNYKWDNSKKFNSIYEKNYISSVEAND